MFNNCDELQTLLISNALSTINVITMRYMFYDCESLTILDLRDWDTSNVTDMHEMFYNCKKLKTLLLSNWTVSNVKDISCMFHGCHSLVTLNVKKWKLPKDIKHYAVMQYVNKKVNIVCRNKYTKQLLTDELNNNN